MTRNGRPRRWRMAELVGVSHQTVSRVVNGKGRVSPRTRERVQAAIEQLGYRPNSVARTGDRPLGHYRRRDHDLGPLRSFLDAGGPEVAAREAGFHVGRGPRSLGPDDVASAFDHFLLAAEAIVVIAPVDSLAEAVAQGASVPVVAVSGGRAFGRGVSVVHADQRGGARCRGAPMTLGHRDTCSRRVLRRRSRLERVAGWRGDGPGGSASMREPLVGSWEARWGYVAGQNLVEDGLPEVMCERRGCSRPPVCLAEAGVSVPGDVSVAGFDDVPIAAYAGRG